MMAALALALGGCASAGQDNLRVEQIGDLVAFEQTLTRAFNEDTSGNDRQPDPVGPFVARRVVLDDGQPSLTVVYLVGQMDCGSGGCTLFVFQGEGDAMRLLSRTTISNPPIQLLESRTNGLPDLAVRVRNMDLDGGPLYGVLRFDGTTYPLNPGMAPAVVMTDPPQGQVIISDDDVRTAREASLA